jgi:hypothetical protein
MVVQVAAAHTKQAAAQVEQVQQIKVAMAV